MKRIHNAEVFGERGVFRVQWLERVDDKTWLRRQAHVSQSTAQRLRKLDHFKLLEWIAKRLPEPVETEQPSEEYWADGAIGRTE
jgi:hypothetical protein